MPTYRGFTRSYTHPSGAHFPAAYFWLPRIDHLDLQLGTASITLAIHPDEASALAGLPPLDRLRLVTGAPESDAPGAARVPALADVLAGIGPHVAAIASAIYGLVAGLPSMQGAELLEAGKAPDPG